MKTKEVTISNIKFNPSTKPLVSEPETYPDYPSVPVNPITNKILTYLPELINAGNHFISLYINTDDCPIEFSTKQPDSSDNPCEDPSLTTDGITFTIYFD